jgi:hypothetical protein
MGAGRSFAFRLTFDPAVAGSLRHFYALWSINRKVDGGLELPIKVVQGRLGHALIQMTADRYGHLFPRGDDAAELAAAERAFLGPSRPRDKNSMGRKTPSWLPHLWYRIARIKLGPNTIHCRLR